MKYLLFSDIHGCLPALERALDFYEAQKCDMMCIMGDIINYGPATAFRRASTLRASWSASTVWQTI